MRGVVGQAVAGDAGDEAHIADLAVLLGLLAATGQCMTARWAFAPVCGFDYWRVIMFSPELLIFLFFMITDPKTVPSGRVGRVAFGFGQTLGGRGELAIQLAAQFGEFGDGDLPPEVVRNIAADLNVTQDEVVEITPDAVVVTDAHGAVVEREPYHVDWDAAAESKSA